MTVLFQYSCGNAINPLLAPLARQTGISDIQTGLFFTLSSLMWLIASPYWGRQSERIGRKRVMLIGLGSCSFLYMLFALISDWGLSYPVPILLLFLLLLLTRILSGVFFSTVPVAAQAYIADTTEGKERTTGITLVWMGSGLGSIVGPSLGAFSGNHLMAPLYIAALLPLLAFVMVWIWIPQPKNETYSTKKDVKKVYPFDSRIWRYLFIITSLQSSVLAMQVTTGFFVKDHFHLSSSGTAHTVGIIFMFAGLTSVGSQIIFVRTLKLPSDTLLKIGTPIILLSFMTLFFHDHIQSMYIAFALLGLGMGFVLPGASSGASLSVNSTEQGAVAGLITAAQGLGTVLGPIIGTSLYHFNPIYPYVFISILFFIASILLWTRLQQHMQKQSVKSNEMDL